MTSVQKVNEPLAIVGIGCRFPGNVSNVEHFWNLIYNAELGIVQVPSDRWNVRRFYDPDPRMPGKVYVSSGGFLNTKIDEFDAIFFGVSPREAACMDPQQRLLLEVTWEALEDAGLPADRLAGSDVGVYVGAFTLDNNVRQMSPVNRPMIGTHTAAGSTMTILSNRLSYFFDFRGPSISIDTACSSSLVALHYACQDLWRGACSLALAGGVNVMFAPEYTVAMCKGQFLAPDGHCKSFDDRANGYARGEGAGVVVLKRWSSAVCDGDRVYAVINATGCNQDGRTSGLTVPNPKAQATLLRRVFASAKVAPETVSYFEAHGTGTSVGDPAEAAALGDVLGAGRSPEQRCAIGSVKANIGHLEAAAGIAGVIKTALCLYHRCVPPLANLQTPNRNIPFEDLRLRLPTRPEPMYGETVHAGVNSFGYGGTNACAVFSSASVPATTYEDGTETSELPHLLPLSARDRAALDQLAEGYAHRLCQSQTPALRDACYSAGVRRAHHNNRVAVWADSREDMADQLQNFLNRKPDASFVAGNTLVDGDRPVFVFTGMGPQWWGMGQELYRRSSAYRQTVEACDSVFQRLAGWSILEQMLRDEDHTRVQETQIAQPANFLVQAGLVALLQSMGVRPAAIIGHSVGEVSAAYVAGVLDLEDALRVSYHRSRIQKRAAGLGAMLAVGMSAEEAERLLATSTADQVSIAAANSPSSTTLSGDAEALKAIAAALEEKGVFNRFLQVEVAYHSPLMDPLRAELLDCLHGLSPQLPVTPLYSTVTVKRVDGITYDAEYWCRNVRQPVEFAAAIGQLVDDGHRVFLEIGPHPVLSGAIKECLAAAHTEGASVATLRRSEPEMTTLMRGIGSLYAAGCTIDWHQQYPRGARFVAPVAYPWQRQSYWNETEESLQDRIGEPPHPLLGETVPGPQPSWQGVLSRGLLPYLDDHHVDGLRVLPGAAYVELGLAIGGTLAPGAACSLEELHFHQALVIEDAEELLLHSTFDTNTRNFAVYSRARTSGTEWRLHATGRLLEAQPEKREPVDLEVLRPRLTSLISADQHYREMSRRGLAYGAFFQGVREIRHGPARDAVLVRIESAAVANAAEESYRLHPALLDACFQALLTIAPSDGSYVPVSISQVRFFEAPAHAFWCLGRRQAADRESLVGDVVLLDDDGRVLAEVRGVLARRLTQGRDPLLRAPEWLYQFQWVEEMPPQQPSTPAHWLVFAGDHEIGAELSAALGRRGASSVTEVRRGSQFAQEGSHRFVIRPQEDEDFDRLLHCVGPERCERIVYLWGLDAPLYPADPVGSTDVVVALRVLQALVRTGASQAFHLFVVTQGAQLVPSLIDRVALPQTPLTGFLRVAQNEYPEYRFTSLDVESRSAARVLDRLVDELVTADPEDEVVLRGAERFVHRLLRQPDALDIAAEGETVESAASSEPFELGISTSGGQKPRLRAVERCFPRPDEIEVRIEALGVDNTILTTFAPGSERRSEQASADDPAMEVVGTVVRSGAKVRGLEVGASVIASLPFRLKNYVTFAPATTPVAPLPRGLSTSACFGLLPFVTARELLEAARLRPGEKILVNAESALGCAVVQLAHQMGGTVFASAGSELAPVLAARGAHAVISTSAADFPDELRALTRGDGVDVVIGTEDGEALTKGFLLLNEGGRYLHVAERPEPGNLFRLVLPLAGNRSFTVFDANARRSGDGGRFRTVWEEIHGKADALDVLPCPEFPITEFAHALGAAIETRRGHTVLLMPENERIERLPAKAASPFSYNAAYLITGGFGGIGLELARWMVEEGARHFCLVGRRGATTPEARRAIAMMEQSGARVLSLAADITDRQQLADVLARMAAELPPLRGVLHTAAVFDDAPLRDLNQQRFDRVMQPKALGALLLHEFTQALKLDFFVLFSSIATQVGSPGQGSYVAANAYLDALAHDRRMRGLPATSVNWGAIGEVGIVSRVTMVKEYLERVGNRPISGVAIAQVLGRVLAANPVQLSVADIDWHQWAQFHPAWAASRRFKHLIADEGQEDTGQGEFLRALMEVAGEAAQLAALNDLVVRAVSQTMQLAEEAIDAHGSLVNMGLDSLMAMELQVLLERATGVKVSTLELMKGVTIEQLSQSLLKRLLDIEAEGQSRGSQPVLGRTGPSAEQPIVSGSSPDSDALERLHTLTSQELDALLADLTRGEAA
jgi:acyl transferase domain-containing protein/aryl carrier-like protein